MKMKPKPQNKAPQEGRINRRTLLITGGKLGCRPSEPEESVVAVKLKGKKHAPTVLLKRGGLKNLVSIPSLIFVGAQEISTASCMALRAARMIRWRVRNEEIDSPGHARFSGAACAKAGSRGLTVSPVFFTATRCRIDFARRLAIDGK